MLIFMSTGCSKAQVFTIKDYSISSIRPTGLNSLSVVLKVELLNKGPQVKVSDAVGTLAYLQDDGRINVGHFTAEPCTIPNGESNVYTNLSLSLDNSLSLLHVLAMARNFQMENCVVDATATVKSLGVSRKVDRKNVPLKSFIDRVR